MVANDANVKRLGGIGSTLGMSAQFKAKSGVLRKALPNDGTSKGDTVIVDRGATACRKLGVVERSPRTPQMVNVAI